MYDLLRGLHIIAVIAWMAGLLYLPRLFVYHTRAAHGSEMDATFQEMERRLLRIIMNPAMVVAFCLGLALIWWDATYRYGGSYARFLGQPWMSVKLAGVVFMLGWHGFLATSRKRFARGENLRSEKFWRLSNELPFVVAAIMVLAVTTEFGSR